MFRNFYFYWVIYKSHGFSFFPLNLNLQILDLPSNFRFVGSEVSYFFYLFSMNLSRSYNSDNIFNILTQVDLDLFLFDFCNFFYFIILH
jgi:hypothetical protein